VSEANSGTPPADPTAGTKPDDTRSPLFLVKGDASPEEVAALTAVLQGIAAAQAPAEEPEVRPEWSAHHRKVRAAYPSGPGGWRSSGLPR
jgi:hypothetical protein